MKIAIVGMGVAGINALKYISKNKNIDAEILVFDDQKYIGKGRAFQYDDPELLMNYPGNLISMKPNKPDDFVKWIEKYKEEINIDLHTENSPNDSGNQYYSRQLFGKYMNDHFTKYAENKNVEIISNHVRNIERIDSGYKVFTQDEMYEVEAIFLSPGQFGPQDPYLLKNIDAYFKWPYPLNRIEIEKGKDYAVIGTGLSAVDIMRYMTPELNTTLYLVSRDGKVQSVRGKMAEIRFKYLTLKKLEKIKSKNNGYLPLEELKILFYKEIKYHNINLDKFINLSRVNPVKAMQFDLSNAQEVGYLQSFILKLTQTAPFIWPFMTRADKALYIERYADKISAYSNPMPEDTAEELIQGINNNKIKILSGVEQVEYKYNKFRIHMKNEEIRVHYLINATGPAKHYKDAIEPNPLIKNLLNHDLLITHPDGGFYVTPINCEVIGASGKLNNFYLLGQKSGGVNYLNNGISELTDEAKRAVAHFALKFK